jgi:hypothetical protein
MDILNRALTILFAALMLPFRNMHPLAGLTAFSVVTGVLMLLVFKWTSNQKGVAAARGRMQGRLLEMRLFAADPVQVLRSAGMLLVDNLAYMRHLAVPMLILILPVVLLLVQAAAWYQYRPVRPGESVIVRVFVAEGMSEQELNSITLDPGSAVTLETPPLRIPMENEINWRVNPDNSGRHTLAISAGGETVEKQLVAGKRLSAVWPERVRSGPGARALNPGEPAIRSAAIQKIIIQYPGRELRVAGRNVHWLLIFFILSLISAYALRGVFKVSV